MLNLQPRDINALTVNGRAQLMMGKFDLALAEYSRVTELQPNGAAGWTGRGTVFRAQGQDDKALVEYDHALRVEPEDNGALTGRAWVALDRGHPEQTVELAAVSVRMHPDETQGYRVRALAEFRMGRWQDAEKDFAQVAKIWPDDAATALDRYIAATHADPGAASLATAARTLQAARAEITDQWPLAAFQLFLSQDTAENILGAAASPLPYRDNMYRCQAEFYLGEHALMLGKKDEAEKYLKAAAARNQPLLAEYQMANDEVVRMNLK